MAEISGEIKKLLELRNKLRGKGRFSEADKIREKIQSLGYLVIDRKDKTIVSKIEKATSNFPRKSFLVIFGSGEIAPSAVKIHEFILQNLNKEDISIAIVTTPAGFQPNVKTVHEEITQFFIKHLQNFHPQVKIVYANTWGEAENQEIIQPIDEADYIFIGPGSPTYAVKNLKNTFLYQKIIEKVKKGASLGTASAASIAFSKFALPVYEIYKAGSPLYWEEGLNLYSEFFRPLTIIPHFNNNEGGRKNDTSRCFIGRERFERLMKMLPPNEEAWGIDEHTAIIIDTQTKDFFTMGKGKSHLIG